MLSVISSSGWLGQRFWLIITWVVAIATASCAQLRIISKAEWNGKEAMQELTQMQLPLQRVIITHTAGADCSEQGMCAQQVRNIQHFHIKNLHFDDISYNFLIGDDGNVYEGRGWERQCATAKNYNAGSVSVAFIGTYTQMTPSSAALDVAKALLEYGVREIKLQEDYKLFGHRQLSATDSPGATLYALIKEWPHWSRTV